MTPSSRRRISSNCPLALLILLSIFNPNQARSTFGKSTLIWGRYMNLGRGGSLSEVAGTTSFDDQTRANDSTEAQQNTNNNTATNVNNVNNITNNETIPEWKRQLPAPLCNKQSRTFQRICVPYQNRRADIYLLGTAHVSNDSSRDVQLLLQSLQPDVIFVELCQQRTGMLEDPPEACRNSSGLKFWEKVTNVQLQHNHSRLQSLATVLLTQTQEEYAESLGVELGGEFRRAYQYWNSFDTKPGQRRPHLILGDRPLAITLARAWESLSWYGKLKVLFGLVLSTFHKPKPEELRKWIQNILDDDTDLLSSSLEDLRKHFPTLERVIIRERDAYMACKLYQLCRGLLVSAAQQQQQSLAGATTSASRQQQQSQELLDQEEDPNPIVIVALVGAGHVPGICEWLTTKTHPQGPEDLLATLIATKKFAHEDLSPLVYDVTELQPQRNRM